MAKTETYVFPGKISKSIVALLLKSFPYLTKIQKKILQEDTTKTKTIMFISKAATKVYKCMGLFKNRKKGFSRIN